MAYYDYYHSNPSWGTQQYQFVSPPMPTYQPQPSWGGADYYRAHTGMNDNSFFDYAWNRVKNFVGGSGVGKAEAKYWHRRVYGGLGDIREMLPSDIGAAAAYETWRNWKHHYAIYGQPLSDDRERQREALIGLAVGEAARLWVYTGRMTDKYGRMEASEAAAAAASRIFTESMALHGAGAYPYETPMLSRAPSMRSMSRARSHSRMGTPFGAASDYGEYGPGGYDGYGARSAYDDGEYGYEPYGAEYTRGRRRSISGIGAPGMMGATPSYVGTPMSMPGSVAPSMSYSQGYGTQGYGTPYAAAPVAYSAGYPAGYAPSGGGMTVITTPSRHRSRHRSRSRHHRRSHSGSIYVPSSAPSYGY